MEFWQDRQIEIDVDAVLRGQGLEPNAVRSRRPVLVELADKAIREGIAWLHPQVTYRTWEVAACEKERLLLVGEKSLTDPWMVQMLPGVCRVTAVVCTVGEAIEPVIKQAFEEDPLYGFALDGMGSAAAEALGMAVCYSLEAEAAGSGLRCSSPLSPGMDGWPNETGQLQIFNLVEASAAGVVCSDSGLLSPRKSVSFVLGFRPVDESGGMAEIFTHCSACTFQLTCRYRTR